MRRGAQIGVICGVIALLSGAILRLSVVSARPQDTNRLLTANSGSTGQSGTQLPDGRWLLLGGEGARGVVGSGSIVDPQAGRSTPISGSLSVPRADHTATVLADGSVLIIGGRNADGVVPLAELFDPVTQAFTVMPIRGNVPRGSHTATLLSDGRVLVAGGTNGGTSAPPTEIWDLETRTVQPFTVATVDRVGHTAALLGDGRVEVTGGRQVSGRAVSAASLVDPVTMTIVGGGPASPDDGTPRLASSSPADGDTGVALQTRIALRFSEALLINTLTADTIRLSSARGTLATRVVGAEGGRLAFVWPLDPLEEATTYTVAIANAIDARGVPLVPATITFKTAEPPSSSDVADEEAWTPTVASAKDGWRSGRAPSPWETMAPLLAPQGVSAVSGRVLRLDGRPLADVTLALEGRQTHTDRTGRFLLLVNTLVTGEHTLVIDARTASTPQRTYGFYEARIGAYAGKTNVLPFTIWSPLLDTAHQVTIPSPTTAETVVTTPTMPGLELHLPAGTVITDDDKHVVRTVTLTPIPLDRTPFPLPETATFTMFFTIQPGGAYLSTPGPVKGGWLVYPNNSSWPVGARVRFFNYDPDDKGWFPYGLGTVTATSVRPDPTTRLYGFTGASFDNGVPTPPGGGTPGWDPAADPVDPSTGAFILTKTDLYLPDVMPIALTRTYNSQDPYPRGFGIGMTHAYGFMQHSANWPAEVDLYAPDGGKLHFDRITDPGLPYEQTVWAHTTTPTPFYQSRFTFWGNLPGVHGWQATQKDGTVYVFNSGAMLDAIRDRYGNETRLTWSFFPTLLQRVTSPNGRWIAFTYGAGNRVSQVSDNIGRTVTYTYDASGRLSTVTDPENNVTTYTWDASNRIATVKDGRNIVYLTNHYDSCGRVDQQTLADPAASYTFAYTPTTCGPITQTDITDPRTHVNRQTFQNHYRVTNVEARGTTEERTTNYDRPGSGNLVTAVVENSVLVEGAGRRTEYTYDDFGHVLTAKRLAGTADAVTTTYTYEPTFFQLATVTDPLTHTWTRTYDTSAKFTGTIDPLGHHTTIGLNAQGQVTDITDPLTHQWQVGYTAGDLTSWMSPLGAVLRRFVDAGGRVLSLTDPLGRITRTTLDKLNRVTAFTDPLGGQTALNYDANSNLLSLTDALTHATGYTYDTSDRVATRTDPLQKSASYSYDRNGNLAQLADRKGQVTQYQYDARDRLTQVTFQDTSTITYTYDPGDRLTQITDSANGQTQITRTYDGLDRLTSETTPQGRIDYTYDPASRRATMTVQGQPTVSYGYDNANRLTSITQGTSVVSFTYDDADRRDTITFPNGILGTYAYDSANQLASLAYTLNGNPVGDLTYTYDLAGNRTSVGGSWARTGLPQALSNATYDAANRIATWAGTTYSYDSNGNLASDGPTSYSWNARNQLTGLSGATNASFTYDGMGRRRSKTISGTMTNFLYDGLNFVQEQANGGSPTANLLTGLGLDEIFTRTDSNGPSTFLVDGLGGTLALASASGSVWATYTFEPFGATTTSGSISSNTVQFAGRETDIQGLYYLRARYYSPSAAQFLSEDPLGFTGISPNLRTYVMNGPTKLVDPLGLAAQFPEPTNPDGSLKPPPMPVPGPPGNEWVPLGPDPKTGRRPWKPKEPCPTTTGSQPRPQWDPDGNHWDYDDGSGGVRKHFLPDGTPVDHWNNPIVPMWTVPPPPTPQQIMQVGTVGTILLVLTRLILAF
jgi:RHS repeat-associated protein